MKKSFLLAILLLATVVYLWGCGKKQEALEQMQEPMSMEALTKLGTENQIVPAQDVSAQAGNVSATEASTKLESLPPSGPYRPTNQEIQTALQNAGYYTGLIDGKMGPKTKKAIEDFQKANNLQADGKVGPKTWSALSKHLNPVAETKKKKKR